MIPRDILKKFRQIELRTNQLVSEASSQPPPQVGRIARTVEDRNDADEFRFHVEIHAVFIEDSNPSFTNRPANEPEALGVLKDSMESRVNLSLKSISQSRLLLVTPVNRFLEFKPGFGFENYLPAPTRLLLDRFFSSARTLSHVIPFSGWRRSRSARSSNSAICSGVNSSSNSSRMRCRTSHLPAKDKRRNCSRSSVLLMRKNYSRSWHKQAAFNVASSQHSSRITFHVSRFTS